MFPSLKTAAPSRPTRSESWHRIAGRRIRLSASIRISRHRYRGETWHVLEDRLTNAFFRVNASAYLFLCLLDGRRTVSEAWSEAEAQLGDEAPTQGEAIQILSQLHEADLLRLEEGATLEPVVRRRRRRVRREFRSNLGALLFTRIPLFNPDRLLDALTPLGAVLISPFGAVLWLAILIAGAWSVIGDAERFASGADGLLALGNLIPLYAVIVCIKLAHELGHGLTLKVLGRRIGGTHVNNVGVLLLLFLPFPYVDASGAWALSSKWQRALVGLAGMIVELGIAGVCAVVWARAGEGTLVASLAYNGVLAAGVSTVLFNANPLMRYDGYHVLSDLMEIPNLASRSSRHLTSLIQKHAYGLPHVVVEPAGIRDRALLSTYALASNAYRIFVYAMIGLFVFSQQFALGMVLLAVAAIELLITPVVKFTKFLWVAPELATRRPRAIGISVGAALSVIILLFSVPLPAYVRLRGIVEPQNATAIFASTSGTLRHVLATGTLVEPETAVVVTDDPELVSRVQRLELELDRLDVMRRSAIAARSPMRDAITQRIGVVEDDLALSRERLCDTRATADTAGTWVRALPEIPMGSFVRAGDALGVVAVSGRSVVRAVVPQDASGRLESARSIAVHVAGVPAESCTGTLLRVSSQQRKDSDTEREETPLVAEYPLSENANISPGQSVIVRARVGDATLGARLWNGLLRIFELQGEGRAS